MNSTLLDKSVKILLLIFFSFLILYYGKPFLVPFLIASLLAMLVLPLCTRLERKMNKILAVLLSILLLLSVISVIIYVFTWQVSDISDKASEIQKNITEKFNQFREFVTNTLGISEQQQQKIIQQQQQSSTGKLSGMLTGFFTSFGSLLTSFLIVMVYIFLFLLFRDHFQKFVLKLVPAAEKKNAQTIMHDVRRVSQKYLTGLALMIACLWVMYSIGFSIVGVENAIFFAILCGLLEIVPFVGNLTGVAITLLMTIAQGGSTNMLIGILIVYAIVQFTQSYILEPMIVGREISINPVFTIVGIVAGELLWGIPGMILALPVLGILKIICDHIEPLKPYGFLIGEEKKKGKNKGVVEKVKGWFGKKVNTNSPNGYTYVMSTPNVQQTADTGLYTWTVSNNGGVQPSFIVGDYLYEQLGLNPNTTYNFVGNSLTSLNVVKFQLEDSLFIHSDIANNGNDNVLQEMLGSYGTDFSTITYVCPDVNSIKVKTIFCPFKSISTPSSSVK